MQLQGVLTTGIYCRADCVARPKRNNVRPMRNAVAALAQGFRPCLLCRPDRLPGFGLDPPADEVAHALRLIAQGYLDGADTTALARRIGYSVRHLVRLFEQHVGASPDFVARARRAHLARRLLDESSLAVADIGFAAGFASVRQMNRVMRELFGFSPSQLRAKRSRGEPLEALDGGLRLRVAYAGRLDGRCAVDYLGARAIPGVERVDGGTYRRTMRACGFPGVVDVTDAEDGRHLCVTLHLATFGSIIDDIERVRALFSTRNDGADAASTLRRDPLLGPLVRKQPGLRMPGAWDGFETAIRILVGQQISVAGASTVTGRIAARFGERIDAQLPGALRYLFPCPAVLAKAKPRGFSMPTARAEALIAFAAAVASGEIDLTQVAPLQRTIAALTRVRGIGPWSAHLIAARVMATADAFPASDLGLRRSAARLAGRTTPLSAGELEQLAAAWRPFRATAAAYLWMSEA